MATNGFLTWADAAGSNVVSDAVYAANNARQLGFTTGRAPSNIFNKAQLQSSVAASVWGQFTADFSGIDCLDSTPLDTLKLNFRMALAAAQSGAYFGIDTSNTANLVNITLVPAPAAVSFANFQYLWIKVANTNTGGVRVQENLFAQRDWLRNDGTPLQAGDLVSGRIYTVVNENGAFKLVGFTKSQITALAGSSDAITLISQQLQNNVKTTTFGNAVPTNLSNGASTAVVFADASTADFSNNGAGSFVCQTPGAYLINVNMSIGTTISQSGSNDVFSRILINGSSSGFNKSPYYGIGASNYFQFVSTDLQAGLVRLTAGTVIQFAAGVTVPAGFVSAAAQGHVASFTKMF